MENSEVVRFSYLAIKEQCRVGNPDECHLVSILSPEEHINPLPTNDAILWRLMIVFWLLVACRRRIVAKCGLIIVCNDYI